MTSTVLPSVYPRVKYVKNNAVVQDLSVNNTEPWTEKESPELGKTFWGSNSTNMVYIERCIAVKCNEMT